MFSPDGEHLWYVAMDERGMLVILDGIEQGVYDYVGLGHMIEGSGTQEQLYEAVYGVKGGGLQFGIADDSQALDAAIFENAITFNKSGERYAYRAVRGGKSVAVVDGVEGPEYDEMLWTEPVWSPEGGHVAYAGKRGGKWCIVIDGAEAGSYDDMTPKSRILFDGENALHILLVKNGKYVTVDVAIEEAKPGAR